jgi:hypothetical protein
MTTRQDVRVGQVWECNDVRRLRAVRVIAVTQGIEPAAVRVENVMSGKCSRIRRDQFTTGPRGWSLMKEKP